MRRPLPGAEVYTCENLAWIDIVQTIGSCELNTKNEKTNMIKIGDIEITLINDARIWMDSGGPFGLVPRALWSSFLQPDSENRVMMDHNCLLVRVGGKTIVIETGWGMRLSLKQEERMSLERPEGGLVAGLAKHGVKPEDVEIVVNTHLHGDHCGGNTRYEGDKIVPVFPNATYMVQRLEAADATYP